MYKFKDVVRNRNLRDIIIVTLSNALVLMAGIFTSFLLPKFLGLTEYGLYKTFTLYTSYTAIIEIGFFEGIYLKYTDVPENRLDMASFRGYFHAYVILNIILSGIIFGLSQVLLSGQLRIIFFFVCIYAVISNIVNYFQIISQCLLRFREYAQRNIIKSILLIVSVSIFYFLSDKGCTFNYVDYLISYIAIFAIIVFWYLVTYKRFVVGESKSIVSIKSDCINFIRLGFPLLIANLCSTFILSLDRQFVSILFPMESYAIYSFAYSMLTLFTTLTSSISLVVFPSLKRLKIDELSDKYYIYERYLFVLASIFLILYFPLTIIINFFLPQYISSLIIFQIILPTLGFSIVVSVLLQNFYKTLGKNREYFIETVIVLVISCCMNGIFWGLFKTMESISCASFFTLMIWYCIAYQKLHTYIKLKRQVSIYPILYLVLIAIFWCIINTDIQIVGQMVIYLVCCILLSFCMLRVPSK